MRKLPNRIPETAELRVVVLRDLIADKEVIPVQQRNTKKQYSKTYKEKQVFANTGIIPEKQCNNTKRTSGKPKKQK